MQGRIEDLFILLVEPSSAQSKIIIKQFEELWISNYELVTTGADVLKKTRKTKPDLIISAMYLPDMTGAELVHSLRLIKGNQELVFMLISTETSFYRLEPVRQAGATAILPKPFNSSQLKKALVTTLDYLEPDKLEIGSFEPENLKVLVVDDSRFARKQIVNTLKKMGVEKFFVAEDGKDAIPIIDNEYFDLVVTDYNMPEVDGNALIEYIRTKSKQPGVPILMVTSEGDMSKLATVEQSGVSAVCDKPFLPSVVKNMIESIMVS